jgi:hypothetical protein
MVVSETEYRQRKLDAMVKKYHDGKYDKYYFEGDNLIVFVKHLKTRDRKNCFNLQGLELKLEDL